MTSCALLRPACCALLLCLCAVSARAQEQPQATPLPSDEIIRVSSDLVQTDVVVFDQQGRFVDNLRPEDFDLRVDGRAQTISFFERVRAGSVNEEAQLAAARGNRNGTTTDSSAAVRPLDRGRLIFFFIDDLHLSTGSLVRTRDMLLRFVNEQLGQNDQAAVVTASGQIGFLQQLTDEKDVLRAAMRRLAYRELTARDTEMPAMGASEALSIGRNDTSVINAYVDAMIRDIPVVGRSGTGVSVQAARSLAENQVRARASQLLQQITAGAAQTLASLQYLLRTTAQLPGRKLVYFISDGFVCDAGQGDTLDRLRRVSDAAVRAGVVVYTLDARGLSAALTGVPDASSGPSIDPTGRLSANLGNETTAMQEPLRIIAGETGGRALLNTNALANALTRALQETSVYYLLAWRPAQEEARGSRFRRIEVSVRQRSDLTVLVQRGFFTTPPADAPPKRAEAKREKRAAVDGSPLPVSAPQAGAPHPTLLTALRSYAPRTALPTSLTLNYFNAPQFGLLLASSLQVVSETPAPGQSKHIDVIGGIYDEQGKAVASFDRHITITPKASADGAAATAKPEPQRIVITHQARITPGLYQVRIAARDVEGERTGSAVQWITVPALDAGKLALSSIFLGERPRSTDTSAGTATAQQTQALVNPERRFQRDSVLRFVLYIYNPARAGATTPPDVALQLQVFRDDQPVITAPLRKVQTEGLTDLTTLPYAAELNLGDLPPGRYVLHATAIDRAAKTSATQHVKFTVE